MTSAKLYMLEHYIYQTLCAAKTEEDYRAIERVLTVHLHYCLTKQNQLRTADAQTKKLNLQDWRIESGGRCAKGAMAQVEISSPDRLAVYSLGKDWGTTPITSEALNSTALHEVLHVFYRPLMDACVARDEATIATLEHSAIVVLEKLLGKL